MTVRDAATNAPIDTALVTLNPGGFTRTTEAGGTGIPVVGDYDGDHKSDVAVYSPTAGQIWWVLLSSTDYQAYTSWQWVRAATSLCRSNDVAFGRRVATPRDKAAHLPPTVRRTS